MRNRWGILAVLFTVRLTMAFQFQSVAAVAPLLAPAFGVGLADIGLLIGLYFTPGIALALPGGAIGQHFGDKATVLAALLLMLAGGLAMALSPLWSMQIAGRLVAGAGGVLLNVQMSKMVADHFAGKEIATAMAIFVNSWPAGVALSLVTLPLIGTAHGISAVYLAVCASIGLGILLFATTYRPASVAASVVTTARLDRRTLVAILIAGLMWGLVNLSFAVTFSFGPSLLVEHGWPITQAGSTISIVLWLAVISVPLAGFLADRIKRPQAVLVASCVVTAALMAVLPRTQAVIATVIGLGLISAASAGPVLSLAARVLQPATRAFGMGIFYTVYYAAMMLGPAIAGACAKWAGNAGAAFDFGAGVLLLCLPMLWLYNLTVSNAEEARPG